MHDAMEDLAEEPAASDPSNLLDEPAVTPVTSAAAGLIAGISDAYDRLRTIGLAEHAAVTASGLAKRAAAAVPHAAVTPASWLPLAVPVSDAVPISVIEEPIASLIVEPESQPEMPPAPTAVSTAGPQAGPQDSLPLPPKWSVELGHHLDSQEPGVAGHVAPAAEQETVNLDWRPLAVPLAPPRRQVSVQPRDPPAAIGRPSEDTPEPVPLVRTLDRDQPSANEEPHTTADDAAAQPGADRLEIAAPALELTAPETTTAAPFALRPAEFRFDTAPGGSDTVATLAAAAAVSDGVTSHPASPSATAEAAASEPDPRRFGSFVRNTLRIAAFGFALWLGTMVLLVLLFRFVDPPSSMLMVLQRLSGAEIDRQWVPLSRISNQLKTAVVVSEDARFCSHWGIDPQEILAAIARARDGVPRGASTITMQVSKNLFLWPSKSYLRKALEVPLTLAIELIWSKSRILEVYLNVAEWGPGIFGAEAAARHHFGKPAARLSAREAALLAVALPSPATRDAGDPGIGTARLARAIEARMRASPRAAHCVAPSP